MKLLHEAPTLLQILHQSQHIKQRLIVPQVSNKAEHGLRVGDCDFLSLSDSRAPSRSRSGRPQGSMVSELRAEVGHGEVEHNEDSHNSMHDSLCPVSGKR